MDISKAGQRANLPVGGTIVNTTIQTGLAVGARATKTGVAWHARRFDSTEQNLRYTRLQGIETL
jgi:hypothetical protein